MTKADAKSLFGWIIGGIAIVLTILGGFVAFLR